MHEARDDRTSESAVWAPRPHAVVEARAGDPTTSPRAPLARTLPDWSGVRTALGPLLALAGPVILAEVGWMGMGVVDTIMVSPLGPEAIGAVGVGSVLFLAIGIFGMGLLLGLDTVVSQAWGATRFDECRSWLVHGVVLALLVALPTAVALWVGLAWLPSAGLHPDVLALTAPYLGIVNWSLVPLLIYAAFRRYLQGVGLARPVMAALLSANIVNVAANWVLIYGRFGAPALGTNGAAWATFASRIYLAAFLLATIVWAERRGLVGVSRQWPALQAARLRRLVGLGFPAAGQLTLEVGVFAAATALAGRLAPVELAAHQIALNIASLTFMVPLGMSSAGAVTVGHAIGRASPKSASEAGWTALALGAAFMGCMALAFVFTPRPLLGIFTRDEAVIAVGVTLLLVAAVFQLFDGLQVIGTGVLRGLGETRSPMLWNLAGHWAIGLPVGYTLCFIAGWGVVGLWIGLSIGLILVGMILVGVWARRVGTLYARARSVS